MTVQISLLEDTIFRLLESAPLGLTVERIRSQLATAGAVTGKHEIVRALAELHRRRMVQMDAGRRWSLLENLAVRRPNGPAGADSPEDDLIAVPCRTSSGAEEFDNGGVPDGSVETGETGIDLLTRLLPYYQECLRTADGGSPYAMASTYGDHFSLLQPDKPWWPTAERGRTLLVPLSRLQPGVGSRLVRQSDRHLLLGYPLYLIPPKNSESDTLIRPVSVFRCRYEQADGHLVIHIPVARPMIVQDWLRGQVTYDGWNASRLLSWLLIEDETADLRPEDDNQSRDFLDIPTFADRLATAAGMAERQLLAPEAVVDRIPRKGAIGYYNGLALFPDMVGRYVRSAISDYDRLCREPPDRLKESALAALFGAPRLSLPAPAVLHPFPLGEVQLLAARSGLSKPLTVITGPPGTGKSQVIAALMLSAAAAGRSVLLAARQHRAIDAVQERLEALTEDRTLLVRANESEGAGRITFADALTALLVRSGGEGAVARLEGALARIAAADSRRWEQLGHYREWKRLGERQAAIQAELDRFEQDHPELLRSGPETQAKSERSILFARMLGFLTRLLGLPVFDSTAMGQALRRQLLEEERAKHRGSLQKVETCLDSLKTQLEADEETPVTLGAKVEAWSAELIEPLLDRLDAVAPEDRQRLATIAGDAQIIRQGGVDADGHRLVLKHMPLWAVTTLAAGSRIPLEPGLFDYVVFDEANVTDIASALPLLFRAKAAVIVGDPMQLGMISSLSPQAERSLLKRHGLLRPGIGRFAQGQTDLFQLAASAIDGTPFLLNEHYRCHPEIAAYFNEAFYGRRLALLTDTSSLRLPQGLRPGLHWTHVEGEVATGRAIGMGGSAWSAAEADAVVTQLEELLALDFRGTVGIVTFFAPQATQINELAARRVGAKDLARLNVKVFTANRFQGDERDVMLLSLCLAPNMPAGARNFLMRERRLLNVAVSRARAICHIVGDKTFAASSGIPHIETLVRRVNAAAAPPPGRFDDRFDSPWEKRLHDALVKRGHNPIIQHPVAGRFLDLAIVDETRRPPLRLDIEVDGVAFHTDDDGNRLATDLWRDHQLKALGWQVLRFWVHELRDEMERCLERIDHAIRG